jgi:hypothetical protein
MKVKQTRLKLSTFIPIINQINKEMYDSLAQMQAIGKANANKL